MCYTIYHRAPFYRTVRDLVCSADVELYSNTSRDDFSSAVFFFFNIRQQYAHSSTLLNTRHIRGMDEGRVYMKWTFFLRLGVSPYWRTFLLVRAACRLDTDLIDA